MPLQVQQMAKCELHMDFKGKKSSILSLEMQEMSGLFRGQEREL